MRSIATWIAMITLLGSATAQQPPTPPRLLEATPTVRYPPAAFKIGVEGKVVFEVDVDADGRAEQVRVVSVPREEMGFRRAVLAAVPHWRFQPATSGGRPVAAVYRGRINFAAQMPLATDRIYSLSSQQAFSQMLELLDDLGVSTRTLDRDNQLIITKWVKPRKKHETRPMLRLEAERSARRHRFQIFIPPWVEPARIHVAVEINHPGETSPSPSFDRWLLDRFEAHTGLEGQAIPMNIDRRYALAEKLLGVEEGSLPCRRVSLEDLDPSALESPERIASTSMAKELTDKLRGELGRTSLFFGVMVMEDGAVGQALQTGGPQLDGKLLEMVLPALRAIRYRPARIGECVVPLDITGVAGLR